jgi:Holliday junction DNA helicase RuvA
MIAHIQGILEEKNPAYTIIDVNGVGYRLFITVNTYSKLPKKGKIRLFTHLHVREDAQILYGFSNEEERLMFKNLINVSGVGTTTAMLILSSLTPKEVASAIMQDDVATLKTIKGIGGKSAQRIIIDLKDKLKKQNYTIDNKIASKDNTIKNEALSAMVVLGIDKKKADLAIDKILANEDNIISVEELIKRTLKSL